MAHQPGIIPVSWDGKTLGSWTTYLEGVYVEYMWGYEEALKYMNGYRAKVANKAPIITPRGIHRSPSQDQYFKGALFLQTLRAVVDDDKAWWKLMRETYNEFKYKNIMTEDIVSFFNKKPERTGLRSSISTCATPICRRSN